jgi:phosphatidylglycerol:prolipoprotein diacylglycerol transferase
MLPHVLGIPLYYVFWGAALCGMIWWTESRAVRKYGMSCDDCRSALAWSVCGTFFGAAAGGFFEKAAASGELSLSFSALANSGLSSGPAFIAGGMFGLYKLKRLGVSAGRFADASAVPAAFMISAGRWGCFFQGCCAGLPTASRLGARFPFSPDVPLWPSQLFESAAAFAIGAILAAIERRRAARGAPFRGAVLFPSFLILYGAYRMFFDFLRPGNRFFGFSAAQYSGMIAVAAGIFWLVNTRRESR